MASLVGFPVVQRGADDREPSLHSSCAFLSISPFLFFFSLFLFFSLSILPFLHHLPLLLASLCPCLLSPFLFHLGSGNFQQKMFEEYDKAWQWVLLFNTLFRITFSERLFSANFGVSTTICSRLWRVIRRSKISTRPEHLVYFLSFIKSYDTLDNLATKFHVTEKTFRSNVWRIAGILYSGLNQVGVHSSVPLFIFMTFFLFFFSDLP